MIKTLKIEQLNFQENEIFIPVFEKKIDKNILFEKLEQKEKKNILERAKTFCFIGAKKQFFSYKNYHFVGLGKEDKITSFTYFKNIQSVFKKAIKDKHLNIYFISNEKYFNQTIDAYYLANYSFNKYKSDKKEDVKANLHLVLLSQSDTIQEKLLKSKCIADGIDLSRDLINESSSSVHPQTLFEQAKQIVDASVGYLELEVLDKEKCQELGMGGFLAVAQGSHKEPFFIIIKTKQTSDQGPVVLIGKSITFDSGGLCIKPDKYMEDMKIDMAGGALVLGVFKALSDLNRNNLTTKGSFVGILPACENMPSSQAMRPGDVITALNGKTIEILHTDAEGRLTLADALAYAEKYLNPKIVIDLATLTGSIVAALGPDIAGLFSNNKDLAQKIMISGDEVGENMWEMPLYESYNENIKSDIADVRNTSTLKSGGGSITASLFLNNFITDKIKWAHIDLGGTIHDKMATGWGVRTVINLLNKLI